jgi:hypothetical protein
MGGHSIWVITYGADGLLFVAEFFEGGEDKGYLDSEGAPWGAYDIVAMHPTKESADAALARAKVTELLLREPWKRAIEHAQHLEAYMREGVRLACQSPEALAKEVER